MFPGARLSGPQKIVGAAYTQRTDENQVSRKRARGVFVITEHLYYTPDYGIRKQELHFHSDRDHSTLIEERKGGEAFADFPVVSGGELSVGMNRTV